MGHSYSFLDVQASIYGPGGNVSLAGDEAGVEQGGIRDVARGDVITCQNCAFAKQPAITYGTDAGAVEWTFNAGSISFLLGM